MDDIEILRKEYNLLASHLREAQRIAARLGVLLEPVQVSAPKRGKNKYDFRDVAMANRMKKVSKYSKT